jgi:hypothetical protein
MAVIKSQTALVVLSALASVALAAVDNVTLSASPPSGAQPLDPALVSFSLEQDRWTGRSAIITRPALL